MSFTKFPENVDPSAGFGIYPPASGPAPVTLVSIAVTPAASTILDDVPTVQFTATGTYSDGSTADITSSCIWLSSNTGVATIAPTTGLATTVAASGSPTTISATFGAVSGNTTLTVSAYPQSANIIIRTPLDGSLTSTTGPDPTFTRTLIRNYANSKRTLAQVATTVPVFGATVFGSTDSLASGLELTGETENLLYYSEDLTQAEWTAIGTGSVAGNTAVDPFGTTLGDSIIGAATGDGYEQITGYATVNSGAPASPTKAYLFSIFLKCTTGTQLVKLQLRDTVDSSLKVLQECRLTTEWQRFEIYGNFPSTTTGFLACGVIVDTSNTCRAFGAQMQQAGNTGGSNMRARACAGPYVKTTNTTKFSNTEVCTYPSATVDGARAEGSVSLWVKTGRGGTILNEGNITDYFSLGSEQFAMLESSEANAVFYIGNAANNVNGMGLRAGVWNHVVVTWKDSTERSLIVNGQIYYDGTLAFTTWTAGLDLYLGQHSGTPQYWSSFATFRNFTMWIKKLTNAEALELYNGGLIEFEETPGTGLLFEVDLGVTPAPTTFNNQVVQYEGTLLPGSFSHTGNIVAQQPYFSDANTYAGLASYANPAYPAAPPLNSATNKGMQFEPLNKNFILQSCAPGTTWTAVGTPTITNAVGNAFGANMPYGSIAGVANDGIKQAISLAAADNSFVVSAWVKVASGTLAGKIIVEGDSGGTPQTATATFTATTTWQHVFKYVDFTGAATGNAQMRLILDATGTLLVSGMQMERRRAGQFCNIQAPGTFIKTTTTTVEIQPNYLWYKTAGNLNPKSGTAVVWAWLDCDSSDIENSDGPNLLSIVGDQGTHVFDLHFVDDIIHFSFAGPSPDIAIYGPVGIVKNQWHQYGISWSANDTGTYDIRVYIDGVLRDTVTGVNGILPGWDRLVVGAGITAQLATDHWKGGIGQIRVWGDQADSYVTADWTAKKAGYGR